MALDNVHLFALELFHNVVSPLALGPYAGADGIHVGIGRPDRQLGAAAGLPGDGLYLHGERGMIFDEFSSKEHEILTGLVTRVRTWGPRVLRRTSTT